MKIIHASFSSTFFKAYLVLKANGFLHNPSYLNNFTGLKKPLFNFLPVSIQAVNNDRYSRKDAFEDNSGVLLRHSRNLTQAPPQ